MTFVMYDSVDPTQIPADAANLAYYANGWAANLGRIRARFPHAALVPTLTVRGQLPPLKELVGWEHGVTIDVENTDWLPGDVSSFARIALGQGVMPHFYCALSSLPLVHLRRLPDELRAQHVLQDCQEAAERSGRLHGLIEELASKGVARDHIKIRTAHWTGRAHICSGIQTSAWGVVNADSTQWYDKVGTRNCDISLCADDFYSGPPLPPPPPPPVELATGLKRWVLTFNANPPHGNTWDLRPFPLFPGNFKPSSTEHLTGVQVTVSTKTGEARLK